MNTGLTSFPLLPEESLGVLSVRDLHHYAPAPPSPRVSNAPSLPLQAPLQCASLTIPNSLAF